MKNITTLLFLMLATVCHSAQITLTTVTDSHTIASLGFTFVHPAVDVVIYDTLVPENGLYEIGEMSPAVTAELDAAIVSGDITLEDESSNNIPSGQVAAEVNNGVPAPVQAVNTKTGTVVLDPDDLDDTSTTNKFTTQTEITKLSGIAESATANDTDANLKARANHTGSQTASTISDFASVVGSSTATFTNKTFDANATGNSLSNVDVADLANGTDGELITWDAAGAPATVSAGTTGQVLTSNGAGAAPTMQTASGGAPTHQVLTDGTTITWDQSLGTFATLTLTDAVGTRTLNITNDVVGQSFLILIQDATDGGELIATWDASIKWTVGIDPTLSTGTSEQDVVVLFSDGTTQYGFTGYDYQ